MSDTDPRRWSCSGVPRDAALMLRRTLTGLLTLILAMCVAAPALDATEGEDGKSADTDATETAESGKDPQEEKVKKEKKERSFAPVPIIITEPAIGYGLGAAIAYFHKKKDQDDSESKSSASVLTADTAPQVRNHRPARHRSTSCAEWFLSISRFCATALFAVVQKRGAKAVPVLRRPQSIESTTLTPPSSNSPAPNPPPIPSHP